MHSFLAELQRRNVFRVAGGYAVVAWLISQMAALLENAMNMPAWFDTTVVSFLLLGFPIALILAWAFESTPEGIKRTEIVDPAQSITKETGRKLDYVLITGLALVGILIIGDRLLPDTTAQPNMSTSANTDALKGQSIAVLPFEDFSPSNDQTYFANGISEELLNVLARVEGLRVASRTSAFSFQEREISIAEIGKALNVAHILEGSVRKAGNTLRITAQLIDAKTDEHMWSETYDRPLTAESIFEIQDDISKAIVLALNGHLDLVPETSANSTQSTEALDAYLKGKEAYSTRSGEGIEEGITELIRAVTLDPNFAIAHAKLARAYTLANTYLEMTQDNSYSRSQIHIERALALAPNDWGVLAEYAWWLHKKWEFYGEQEIGFDEVLSAFDAAIMANPNNAEAHRGRGWTLATAGRFSEAKVALETAKVLNPKEPLVYLNLTRVASGQGDVEAYLNLAIQAVKLDPEALFSRSSLAYAYEIKGEIETAHRIYQSCLQERACGLNLGDFYAKLGIEVNESAVITDDYTLINKHQAAKDFDKVAEILSTSDQISTIAKTRIYAQIGRWEEAYQLVQENPSLFEPFLQGKTQSDLNTVYTEIALLSILLEHSNSTAQLIKESLSTKYRGKTPDNLVDPFNYFLGAAWYVLNGDPDTAMEWLNALAERGISTPIDFRVIFDSLEQRTDYQAFITNMNAYMARDRGLIKAQLDNPPDVWWSPGELPEDNN